MFHCTAGKQPNPINSRPINNHRKYTLHKTTMKQLTTTSSKTTTNIKLKHLKSWYSTSLIVSYWCGYLFPFVSFHQWHIAATIKLDNKTFNVLNLFVEKWYTIKRHQKHLETYRFNTWWPVAMVRVVKLTFVFGKRFVVMRSTCSISIFHYYHNTTQLDDVVLFMEFENLLGLLWTSQMTPKILSNSVLI